MGTYQDAEGDFMWDGLCEGDKCDGCPECAEERMIEEVRDVFRRHWFRGYGASREQLEDFDGREIIATPYNGAYGPAGWVLVMNGSPPRGMIVSVQPDIRQQYTPPVFFFACSDGSRRLTRRQAEVIRDYIDCLELPKPLNNHPHDPAPAEICEKCGNSTGDMVCRSSFGCQPETD